MTGGSIRIWIIWSWWSRMGMKPDTHEDPQHPDVWDYLS